MRTIGMCGQPIIYTLHAIGSVEDLITRISVAATSVCEIPGIFDTVRKSLHRRCQAFISVGVRNLNSYCKHTTVQRRC